MDNAQHIADWRGLEDYLNEALTIAGPIITPAAVQRYLRLVGAHIAELAKAEKVTLALTQTRSEWDDVCAALLAAKDKWTKGGEYPRAAVMRRVVDNLTAQLATGND